MKKSITSLAFVLAFGAMEARADAIYQVVVNTQSIAGQTGFVDFQFNPGAFTTQSATLKIQNFSGATYVAGSQIDTGSASGGPLPGTVTLTNSTVYNDDFESVKFGGTMTFFLDFGGSAITAPNGTARSGSSFAFSMFDSTGNNPLLTNDPNGFAAVINVNTSGNLISSSTPSSSVSVAPEPASLFLLTSGGFALLGFKLRKRR